MTDKDKFQDYYKRLAACHEFQAQLERQFGSRAGDMRYVRDKSIYDEQTMRACRVFREAVGLPLVNNFEPTENEL